MPEVHQTQLAQPPSAILAEEERVARNTEQGTRSIEHDSRFTIHNSRPYLPLFYLSFALLKGKMRRFARNLRRPTTAIGFASLLLVFGTLFYFRDAAFFGE